MKKSFHSRFRNDLFPKMPQSYADGLQRALTRAGANPRKLHLRTVLPWAAAAALLAVCAVIIAFGVFARMQKRNRALAAPGTFSNGASLIDTWEVTQYDYNGVLLSAQMLGGSIRYTFNEDGTAVLSQTDREDETLRYSVEGDTVHLDRSGQSPVEVDGPSYEGEIYDLRYDPEADTLTSVTAQSDSPVLSQSLAVVLMRVPHADPAVQKAVGTWAYAYGAEYAQRITIRADGTATLRQTAGMLSTLDVSLTYTVSDGVLTFSGADIRFAARCNEDDTLTVAQNGEERIFTRAPLDLVGKWSMTGAVMYGKQVDADALSGLFSIYLEFTDDGVMTLTGVSNSENIQERGRYTVNGYEITVTDEDGDPLTISYDPGTDTLGMEHSYSEAMGVTLVFSRTPDAVIPEVNKPDLVGKWTMTRAETVTESAIQFGNETVKWEDVTDRIDYQSWLEFTAGGYLYLTVYDPDMGEALHNSGTYTVSGDTVTAEWSESLVTGEEKDVSLAIRYDAESDTICTESNGKRREYFSRTPDAVIPEPERKEIAELRTKYPEYFGLDTSKGLKVCVWQMAENDYSCALLSGTDERSETKIGIQSKGITIEEMRMILSTYGLEEKDIDVVPIHNPLSSYWYEIDAAYTAQIKWLLLGTPIKDGGDLFHEESNDTAVCDVDGDGRLETCVLSYGPTSGLFTVVFTAYRNGTLAYRNTFNMEYGELTFGRSGDGLVILHVVPGHDGVKLHKEYRVSVEDGAIVLTDEEAGEAVPYWGAEDTTWNMAVAKQKTPEDMLEGLWCAMSGDPDQVLLLEIRFYTDEATHKRMAEIKKDGISCDGYSYTVEEGERNEWKTDNPWYRFTFTKGDEAFMIDMCMDMDNKEPDYIDWNVGKGEGGWKSYLKRPVIEADELPYQQQASIGEGEGYIGYLDLVDLNGDGNPVRVKVASSNPNWYIDKGEEITLTVQIGRGEWTVNEELDWDSVIYADLDPNDGHGNVLLSAKRADGTTVTYELHQEGDKVVCGHAAEGYCFLADSPEQELTLGVPTDLFGAKYGYREVRGEALEPVDDLLHAYGVIEAVTFGPGREKNIEDGTLLHLVRALPCEIDGVPGTLEPGVYIYLCQWNEALTEIIFSTEDGRWITVHPDAGLMLDGVSLYDYFDNAPQG